MRKTNLTRAEQISNAIAQQDYALAERLSRVNSSSVIIQRASSGYYVKHKDKQPTQRPFQAEEVFHNYRAFEEGLPKTILGLGAGE